MKLLLKNIKENYSREEKQEEDNLNNLNTFFTINFGDQIKKINAISNR